MKKNGFFGVIKFLLRFIFKADKRWFVITFFIKALKIIKAIFLAIYPSIIIDAIFSSKELMDFFPKIMIFCIVLLMLDWISQLFQFINSLVKNELFHKFDNYMNKLVLEMDYAYTQDPKTLDLQQKAYQSAYSNGKGFCATLEDFFDIITDIIIILSISCIVISLHYLMIIIIVLVLIVNSLTNYFTNKKIYEIDSNKKPYEREYNYIASIITDFSFAKETRINAIEDYLIKKYDSTFEKVTKFYKKNRITLLNNQGIGSFTYYIQYFAAYLLLGFEVIKGKITYGLFTMYFNAIFTLSNSLNSIVNSLLSISSMKLYINDLVQFTNLPRKNKVVNKSISNVLRNQFTFEFKNVSFTYPGSDKPIFENLNLKINSGEKIAFVGFNGSGKTTFIKLLLRLYEPNSGKILLNGIDIKDLTYMEYLKLFAVVFQDYKLFAYSVKENIVFDREQEVFNAINKSGLKDKIDSLPNKENTFVYRVFDENGFEPSGGEAQRIAIARAFAKESTICILDEPTSALDPIAELDIFEKMQQLTKDKTSIFISHRLGCAKKCSRILVFENGKIVEDGNHDKLMKKDGLYKKLFDAQSQNYK